MKSESRGIQSVEVGGRILKALAQVGRPVALRELATMADLPPAQAHAYLVSFKSHDLVEQDLASGRYELGPFALRLGLARMQAFEPLRLAEELASELSERTGAMVTVTVWSIYGACIASIYEGSGEIRSNLRAGSIYSLLTTATGAVFLAFLPEDLTSPFLEAELARAPRPGMPAGEMPPRDMSLVQNLGYAVNHGLPTPGLNALSVPIFDRNGLAVVLGLIGPSSSLMVDEGSEAVRIALETTTALSLRLGADRPAAHGNVRTKTKAGGRSQAATRRTSA